MYRLLSKDEKTKSNYLSLSVFRNECLPLSNSFFNSWLKFQAVIPAGKGRVCEVTFCFRAAGDIKDKDCSIPAIFHGLPQASSSRSLLRLCFCCSSDLTGSLVLRCWPPPLPLQASPRTAPFLSSPAVPHPHFPLPSSKRRLGLSRIPVPDSLFYTLSRALPKARQRLLGGGHSAIGPLLALASASHSLCLCGSA